MRIGVIGCFYGCADLLPRVLEPWIALKNEGLDIHIGAVNAQFKEYAELGYPNDDHTTRGALLHNQHVFDVLEISKEPLQEHEARNRVLTKLLAQGVDLVWLVDGDETYTTEQIKNILGYIEQTPGLAFYHIHLRNRVFDTFDWQDDFFPPRVFRTNRHGGIKGFEWDNDMVFIDGTRAVELVPGIVPKALAYIEHRTWRKTEAAQKIEYHERHFGRCAFALEDGELVFNATYFARYGIPLPIFNADKTAARAHKERLTVVLRTHSTSNYRPGMQRVTDTRGGKPELVVRSLRSLVRALLVLARANQVDIELVVVDDHSDAATIARIQRILDLCPFDTTFEPLEGTGNAASMRRALELGRDAVGDFVYFVEDDYLHEQSALLEMYRGYRIFARNLGRNNIGLFPVDQHEYYLPHAIQPSRIVPGSARHWRTNTHTTSTFFIPKSLLVEQWEWFIKNPESERTSPIGMTEEGSINVVWQEHATLFTPIPTLAYHVHGESQMPPFSAWEKLWNSLETFEL